jgi:hypothetical protein
MTPSPASSAADREQVTPWFPASLKPAREGTYEVRETDDGWTGTPYRLEWNGRCWMYHGRVSAFNDTHRRTEWRGLAHPPKGAK